MSRWPNFSCFGCPEVLTLSRSGRRTGGSDRGSRGLKPNQCVTPELGENLSVLIGTSRVYGYELRFQRLRWLRGRLTRSVMNKRMISRSRRFKPFRVVRSFRKSEGISITQPRVAPLMATGFDCGRACNRFCNAYTSLNERGYPGSRPPRTIPYPERVESFRAVPNERMNLFH